VYQGGIVQTVLFENLFILIDILIVLRVGMLLGAFAIIKLFGYFCHLVLKASTEEEIDEHIREAKEKSTEKYPAFSNYNELHAAVQSIYKAHPSARMIFEFIAYALWLGSRYIL
jgi:hypothetical protein